MRTRRENFFLIVALGILNALTPFSIDLYLPAFPSIAGDLNTDVARMSLTVSFYFVGFACGQILYGPFLDRFGRKLPIYFGLALYVVATIGCMNARSLEALMFFRLLSALGGASASVGSMSMVRDYFPASESGKIFSMLMLVLSVSPLLAPSIGSLMIAAWGWRTIFAALAGLAIVDLLIVARLPRGYAPDPAVALRPGPIFSTFRSVFRERDFRAYSCAGALSFAGLFVFVSGSPALFMADFAATPAQFGGIFAILAGAMVGGGQLNHLLLRRWSGQTIFRTALLAQVAAALVFLCGSAFLGIGLVATVAVLFFVLLTAGISYPNAASLALAPLTRNIGSAASLLGFIQLGLGSVAAALVGLVGASGSLSMASVMFLCSGLGFGTLVLTKSRRPEPAPAP